jgi:hypothetical protein
MTMHSSIKVAIAGSAAVMLAVAAWPALAEIEVLESSAPGMAVGQKLPDNARLSVPTNTVVRLLIRSPGGTSTKTLRGPFEGTAAEYKEKRSWWARLFQSPKDTDQPMAASKAERMPTKPPSTENAK